MPHPACWSKEVERSMEQSWTQLGLQPSPAARQKHEQEINACCSKLLSFPVVVMKCYCGNS